MARVESSYSKENENVVIWLIGKTVKDRRLLTRLITAFADEINARMAEEEWDTAADLVVTGADLIKLRDDSEDAEWEAEDEAV